MRLFLLSLLSLSLHAAFSQSSKLVSGPMLGYTAHHEQLIWIEVASNVRSVAIEYWQKDQRDEQHEMVYNGLLGLSYNPLRIILKELEMSTTYEYQIRLNGEVVASGQPQQFTTRHLWEWREPAPDFSFLFGSCAYVNDPPFDRPGKPYGQGLQMLETMGNTNSDFMLWGGDNNYLREADWSSVSGLCHRYSHDRRQPEMARLLATRPNFAIWDDHDFGPNNSNSGWRFKEETLEIFNQYWGHQTWGEPNNAGNYTKLEWSDCDFFLLDNRYHRSPEFYHDSVDGTWNEEKQYLGKEQLEWLKTNLANSRASFKFIVSGSQVVNVEGEGECFCNYQREWRELIDFIKEYDVRGVVFLSGDRHFSEVLRYHEDGLYPLHEVTSSPLAARPYEKVVERAEAGNPLRLEGTLTNSLNFMKLSVTGERGKRVLTISCFDQSGNELWTKDIEQPALRIR